MPSPSSERRQEEPKLTRIVWAAEGLSREAPVAVFRSMPGFVIAGEAATGRKAMELAKQTVPDILVADIRIQNPAILRVAKDTAKRTRLIIQSYEHPPQITAASGLIAACLREGARGYVPLHDTEEVADCIKRVMAGEVLVLPDAVRGKVEAYLQDPESLPSRRELEVLQLCCDGLPAHEIGKKLFISARTVESHQRSLQEKMNVKNQKEMIGVAVSRGLVTYAL